MLITIIIQSLKASSDVSKPKITDRIQMVSKMDKWGNLPDGKMKTIRCELPIDYIVAIARDLYEEAKHYYMDMNLPGAVWLAMEHFEECALFCAKYKENVYIKQTEWHDTLLIYQYMSESSLRDLQEYKEIIKAEGFFMARTLRAY